MTRYYYSRKQTVEECISIDSASMKAWGCFKEYYNGNFWWGRRHSPHTRIGVTINDDNNSLNTRYTTTYKQTGELRTFDYVIPISTTKCNYGGIRHWLHCPYCDSRNRTLHLGEKEKFACRKCLNLSYKSQNKGGYEKIIGSYINYPELEKLRQHPYISYKGKPTKTFIKYLRYEKKFRMLMSLWNIECERNVKKLQSH